MPLEQTNLESKLKTLVQRLVHLTEADKLDWQETADEDAFRATLQGGMIRIQRETHWNENDVEFKEATLTLLDRNGKEVENYIPSPLHAEELFELWKLARRSARKSVDILDNLLSETEKRG